MISTFVLLVASVAVSDREDRDAGMFLQSYLTPAIFDTCKTAMPERISDFETSSQIGKRQTNEASRAARRSLEDTQAGLMWMPCFRDSGTP
ncbi:MAG: hypothetical protein IPK97_11135 [Ahniella sp.]|nr:hypothetical protein [Ahniella sp.]